MLTRYELGIVPAIPMRVHLSVDALAGILLLTFALGAFTAVDVGAAAMTDPAAWEGRWLPWARGVLSVGARGAARRARARPPGAT